jgi:hypothetical protein
MSARSASGLTADDLQEILRRADPAALLVPPRILRRVIKRDRGLSGFGLQVPHRKSYVLGRDSLFAIADLKELGLTPDQPLPETLYLFPTPFPQRLASLPREALLVKYWRLLFHARVHAALERRAGEGGLTDAAVRARVRRIGVTEFEEARAVLRQERLVLPPGDLRAAYEEFAAVFLELRFFDPRRLKYCFPSIASFEEVGNVLAEDVDAEALFAATRPEGAPDPKKPDDRAGEAVNQTASVPLPPPPPVPDERAYQRLLARAEDAAARGNAVRAAILRQSAIRVAAPDQIEGATAAAREAVEQLLGRLQKALDFPATEVEPWRAGILALLEPASRGLWPVEARLLYDLQKVCIDQERAIYALDLVEWFVSWGRRPVQRVLPNQGQVLTVKHLRSAARRLGRARLPEGQRRPFGKLLHAAVHRSEEGLRDRLRPAARMALDDVDLRPEHVPEAVARDKLVEELLDRVVERGFLLIGDLRDAIARNRLKLPDLAGPAEFFTGDRLIRANRRFAAALDGIYRRGEIYLRWLQRLSSLAFGTRVGRFLTRYLALPFGGAYLALEGTGYVIEEVAGAKVHLANEYSLPLAALFLFGLLYTPRFRRGVAEVLRQAWRVVRGVCYDLPRAVVNLPLVRAILNSRPYLILYLYAIKPLAWAVPVALGLWLLIEPLARIVPDELGLRLLEARRDVALGAGGAVFLLVGLLINSRLGMQIEEELSERLARAWNLVRFDLLPGLFRLVLSVFKQLVEDVEKFLYAVDERLRFKTGDSRLSLYLKPVLGLAWFFVTYLIRVVINLFVEPTFNPIKHFPVVTVAAKMLLPFLTVLEKALRAPLEPYMGIWLARVFAAVIILLLPGLAGFIVWELKENWKLYRANQSPTLDPVLVGGHGETVLRLLRPGLHSGTLPKLYAKLRRARGGAVHKQRDALHHVAESVRHFVERDLLPYLAAGKSWGPAVPGVWAVRLGCNRIRIDLACPALADENLTFDLEEHGGRLVAGVARAGWSARLGAEPARAFSDALAGFYKLAGVDLVREQLADALLAGSAYELLEEGLIVWTGPGYESGALYELNGDKELSPRPLAGTPSAKFRKLKGDRILFREVPIIWADWVEQWDADAAGKGHRNKLLRGVRLLPGRE